MGIRDALERIVNIILIFMIVCLGFVMRCELFHITIYDSIYSKFGSMKIDYNEDQLSELKQDLINLSNEGNWICYPVFEKESELETKLSIYVNSDEAKNYFIKKTSLKERKYKSLLNGNLSIIYKNMDELSIDEISSNNSFLILNNSKETKKILSEKYETISQGKSLINENDMIIIVWTLIGIMILIISLITVFRRKKSIILRAVYGENLKEIVIKSFLLDLIIYELIYIVAKLFVFKFISGDYRAILAFCIYQICVILAALCNFLLLKMNIKAVFSNINDNKNALMFLYFIKLLAFSLVVFSLATNISSIGKNTFKTAQKKQIESIKDDVFITDTSLNFIDYDVWDVLNESDLNIKLCMKINDGKYPYIIVNESAIDLLPDNIKQLISENQNEESDCLIIHSKKKTIFIPEVEGIMSMNELDDFSLEELEYSQNISMLCIGNSQYNRFENVSNPTIIYLKGTVDIPKQMYAANRTVIYGHSKEEIENLLGDSQYKDSLIISKVGDIYDYQMSFIKRLVSFLASLCVLVIILELVMIIQMLGLEFREYAMEHAVKEMLGLSFFERNKYLLLKMNIGNVLAILVAIGIGVATGIFSIITTIIIGLILDIIENVIIALFIIRQEKISMVKTLKGGCL
ncbi:hypothetical protein [Lachnospira pectinoschiza]|uniref:Bacteriocin-associated integral membrane protein n=1 Tax=Lachnospira pectinoschiza TaxID=28052 RepID=A0A1G9T373_9FIRM|nr:hypothetical protein [Lachnospira pectinoschiza]SDM42110.1 hypothetical protein SAMN05216544_0194 [Lachnospira pectinoschiza]